MIDLTNLRGPGGVKPQPVPASNGTEPHAPEEAPDESPAPEAVDAAAQAAAALGLTSDDIAAALSSAEAEAPDLTALSSPAAPKLSGTRMGPKSEQAAADAAWEAMFAPNNFGKIVSTGLSNTYQKLGAEKLSREEGNLIAVTAAYWAQTRMPAGAGKVQPEILLLGAVAVTAAPRIPERHWRTIGAKLWQGLKSAGKLLLAPLKRPQV